MSDHRACPQSGGQDSSQQPEARTRVPNGSNTLAPPNAMRLLHKPLPLPLIGKQKKKGESVRERECYKERLNAS